MNAVAKNTNADIMEQVIIKGDLSKLTPQERTTYYMRVCESVGLNPLTRPFEYINLNGKLQLYALKACTEQLRGIYGVSVTDLSESMHEGVFIVTAKVVNKEGRTDAAKGAVPLAGLKGEALANAMMKAETKAKRRATLSLCGLGWLDESEIESIPGAQVVPNAGDPLPQTIVQAAKPDPAKEPEPVKPAPTADKGQLAQPSKQEVEGVKIVYQQVQAMIEKAPDNRAIDEIIHANKKGLKELERISPKNYERLKGFVTERRAELISAEPGLNDDIPDMEDIPA